MNIVSNENNNTQLQQTTEVESHVETYVEAPLKAPTSVDPLGQFKANLDQLERMQAKMSFMLQEVHTLVK